ncbi:50S ribosomal protein L32 [candidate division KSB1 bacterium]
MANPKRRQSKARRDKRRTHWKLTSSNFTECTNCHEQKLAHRVCPSCGYYRGKEIFIPSE